MTDQPYPMRAIRSFVRREGRMTLAQKHAYTSLWANYGINTPEELETYLSTETSLLVEVGFGMGDNLISFAKQHLDWSILGIEVYRPGIGALLNQLQTQALRHVKVIVEDAATIFSTWLPLARCARVHIFFPDPWPKARHQKRRLIQSDFVSQVTQVLQDNGILHIATDSEHYAKHVLSIFSQESCLEPFSIQQNQTEHAYRSLSKFAKKAAQSNSVIWDIEYRRKP
jgi:tRNA (guanine-N7-)-methyltransferase